LSFIYRVHAIERMFERDITEESIEKIVNAGEVIETYPDDKPYVSYLVLGYTEERPIHVVYAIDENNTVIIITAYEPTLDIWKHGFKERKR